MRRLKLRKIYLAAPIHQKEDFIANAELLVKLREKGFDVWSPQEAGIASEEAKQTGEPLDVVRERYMQKDIDGMEESDICLAFLGRQRPFSEGMLWEMGWFVGRDRPVILYNPYHNKVTLMAQFTVSYTVNTFEELLEVLSV